MQEFFEFPPTRSNRAKWALEELGIDYTSRIVDFTKGEQRSDVLLEVHALGQVPIYRTERYAMHESVAIVLQLLDEHPHSGLAPPIGSAERALYYQWCVFASAELDHACWDVMKHTMHYPRQRRVAAIAARGRDRVAKRCALLSDQLRDRDFLLGKKFSGADIAIGYSCNWLDYVGMLETFPTLVGYYRRLQERPAFKRVFG